jgi:hypothetical protein
MAAKPSPNFPAPVPQWLTRPALRLEDPDRGVCETLPPEVLEAAERDDDFYWREESVDELGRDNDAWPERPHDTALIGGRR